MPLYRFPEKIVLFIHIPKAGGSSVEAMLRNAGGREALWAKSVRRPFACSPQHLHAEILDEYVPAEFYDLSFALCRNPYDRLFSEYKMRAVATGKATGFDDWFDEAMGRFKAGSYANDNHLRAQHEFPVKGCLLFKMEDGIGRAVGEVCEKIGVTPPSAVPSLEAVKHKAAPAKRSTLAEVASIYAKDFKKFGYDAGDFRRSFVEQA